MKLKIEVTQEDIDTGKRKNIFQCPLAKALKREIGEEVRVVTNYFEICSQESLTPYDLSEKATEFRRRFDNKLPVAPFTFEIDI